MSEDDVLALVVEAVPFSGELGEVNVTVCGRFLLKQ